MSLFLELQQLHKCSGKIFGKNNGRTEGLPAYQHFLHPGIVDETCLVSFWGSTVSKPICRSSALAAALSIRAGRLFEGLSDFCFEMYVMLEDE